MKRKEKMFQMQKKRSVVDPKLEELDMKANLKSKYLYERAQELRREQEDIIKMCNGLILSKKCQAIRDAQIAEKRLLEKEAMEEEKRLEKCMENERLKALQKEEAKKMNMLEKKNKFINELKDQIQFNENERVLLAEIMNMESRLANRVAVQVRQEEEERLKEKSMKQQQMKSEMLRINEELKHLAENERIKQSMADLRIQEYLKLKADQEAKREEELIKLKKEKERQMAQFRKGYEKYDRHKALKEDMLVLKLQHEVEKKWRAREREAALKRVKLSETLFNEREKQIQERRKCQALEIEKQRIEREEMAKLYSQALEKEKKEEQKHRQDTESYRLDLLRQMTEKEYEKLQEKEEHYLYAANQNKELEENDKELKKLMRKKMEEMRKHRVPEKYVKEIERRLHIV